MSGWARWGIAAFIAAGGLVAACSSDAGSASSDAEFVRSSVTRAEGSVDDSVVAGNTAFAVDLYGKLRGTEGNLFLSPFSVSEAMAMAWAGAKGETKDQITAAFHYGSDAATHATFDALDRAMRIESKDAVVSFGNALWTSPSLELQASYLDLLAENYGAGVGVVDFSSGSSAVATIDGWVSGETRGKIPALLDSLPANTAFVLTNAVYLKARWQQPFELTATRDQPFTLANGSTVSVEMMQQFTKYPYTATDTYQAVALPYGGGAAGVFRLVAVLPTGALSDLEASLTAESVQSLLGAMNTTDVSLQMPRFETRTKLELQEALESLGVTAAFDDGDFSGMATPSPGHLARVAHEGYLSVNEDGTEAAAATAVIGVDGGASVQPPDHETVNLNHPFLIFVEHVATHSVLFMGRVSNPLE